MRWRIVPPVLSPVEPRAIPAALFGGRQVSEAPEKLRVLLRQRYGADQVLLAASGTQALQLAITTALRRHEPGAKVALPGFGCYDLATAAIGAGATVLLYDMDAGTLAPDLESLERVLGRGCRVVVVAPLYGVPVDWESIRGRCQAFGAVVIEDAAQGHGAEWGRRPLGSLGELSILSFGRGKGWTGSHGGALLFRGTFGDSQLPDLGPGRGELAGVLKLAAQWLFTRPSLYRFPASIPALGLGETRYHDPVVPTTMEPTTAFLTLKNDTASKKEIEIRRSAAAEYDRLCDQAGIQGVREPKGGVRGALRYPVLAPAESRRIPLVRALGALPGYPLPLNELAALRPMLDSTQEQTPQAARLARELLTLPTHSKFNRLQQSRLVEILGDMVNRA